MARKKFYVVFRGRQPGIYKSWERCSEQVMGFRNNLYRGFDSLAEAMDAFDSFASVNNSYNTVQLVPRNSTSGGITPESAPMLHNQATATQAPHVTNLAYPPTWTQRNVVRGRTGAKDDGLQVDPEILSMERQNAFAMGCLVGVLATIATQPRRRHDSE